MPTTIGLYEAKTHLGQLIDGLLARGDEIIITRYEKPVARLLPPEGHRNLDEVRSLISEILQTRQGHVLNPAGKPKLTVKELVNEGRRY